MDGIIYNEVGMSLSDTVDFSEFSRLQCDFNLPSKKTIYPLTIDADIRIDSTGKLKKFVVPKFIVRISPKAIVTDTRETFETNDLNGTTDHVLFDPQLRVNQPSKERVNPFYFGASTWNLNCYFSHQELLSSNLIAGDSINIEMRVIIGFTTKQQNKTIWI